MKNELWPINLWQVISCDNGKDYFSFYKTVLLNTKVVAIEINNREYKQLAKRLWPDEVVAMKNLNNG